MRGEWRRQGLGKFDNETKRNVHLKAVWYHVVTRFLTASFPAPSFSYQNTEIALTFFVISVRIQQWFHITCISHNIFFGWWSLETKGRRYYKKREFEYKAKSRMKPTPVSVARFERCDGDGERERDRRRCRCRLPDERRVSSASLSWPLWLWWWLPPLPCRWCPCLRPSTAIKSIFSWSFRLFVFKIPFSTSIVTWSVVVAAAAAADVGGCCAAPNDDDDILASIWCDLI